MNKNDFTVKMYFPSWGRSFYISDNDENYLWHDGTTNSQYGVYKNRENAYQEGCWRTRQEAEEFLRNWKGSNMIDDKINQCKKDIEKLQEQLEELEEEKKNSEHYTIGWSESNREIGFFVSPEVVEYVQRHEGEYVFINGNGKPDVCMLADTFKKFTTTRFRKGDSC